MPTLRCTFRHGFTHHTLQTSLPPMLNFAAIDFETANSQASSVCSVGVVIVRNGEIVDSYYSLIRPEPNFYSPRSVSIHGINKWDTERERSFPEVWSEIAPLIEGLPLVAHNKSFDERCLKRAFEAFNMPYPYYDFFCTLKASRQAFPQLPNHKLHTVSEECGYSLLNHHHALADAEACAWIAREIL